MTGTAEDALNRVRTQRLRFAVLGVLTDVAAILVGCAGPADNTAPTADPIGPATSKTEQQQSAPITGSAGVGPVELGFDDRGFAVARTRVGGTLTWEDQLAAQGQIDLEPMNDPRAEFEITLSDPRDFTFKLNDQEFPGLALQAKICLTQSSPSLPLGSFDIWLISEDGREPQASISDVLNDGVPEPRLITYEKRATLLEPGDCATGIVPFTVYNKVGSVPLEITLAIGGDEGADLVWYL